MTAREGSATADGKHTVVSERFEVKRWMVGVGLLASLVLLAACTGGFEAPTPTATSTPTSQSVQSTRPLVAPTSVAVPAPPAQPTVLPPAVPLPPPPPVAVEDVYTPEDPDIETAVPEGPLDGPAPNPLDSRGFPLGTTCGPVSCTSPEGFIFDNPDAVPGAEDDDDFNMCERTYCAPPGFAIVPGPRLPSTGSAGGF